MINLNEFQTKIYDSVKNLDLHYSFEMLSDLKNTYTDTFKDISKDDFEKLYKNNELNVIRKIYSEQTKNISDEELLKYKPRGCFPIVGKEEYLKYSRILGNSDIYNNPHILDTNVDLLDDIIKQKIKITFSVVEEVDPNIAKIISNIANEIKNKIINNIKDFLGIESIKFENPIDERNSIFNETVTDKKTVSEEMPKIPHQIRSFGEPKSTANPRYPYNNIYMSPGGHITEFDDTPESRRIRIQHANGSKMEVDGDGNHILKSTADRYDIIDENRYKYVKGHTTEVSMKKVMKTYSDGILYQSTNVQTYASERVHYQVPIISYSDMLLGKNAIFSNNVIVKNDITSKTAKIEEKLSAKNGLIKTLKGDWGNILSRESTVAWDIGAGFGSSDMDSDSMPSTPPEDRKIINKSMQFKEGANGDPTFIKKVKHDLPIDIQGIELSAAGGRLCVNGRPLKFADEG